MSNLLENQVALVTGGSRGIGKAIAQVLSNAGATVCIVDIRPVEESEEWMKEIRAQGKEALALQGDVSSLTQAVEIVDQVVARYKRLDILVNNAGITRDGLLLRMSENDWDMVLTINLKSVFNYTKAASKPMMSQRSGKIINISSVIGITGNAGQSNYAASKAGVIGFTKSTAKEFSSRNIQVNAIAPGFIETEMTAKLTPDQQKAIIDRVPLKRIAKPEEVGAVVLFLASHAADYITGQVISVDGGLTLL